MTPERLAEIRAFVAAETTATHPAGDYLAVLLSDILAAYDALASGSALREARAEKAERERDEARVMSERMTAASLASNQTAWTNQERAEQAERENDVLRRAVAAAVPDYPYQDPQGSGHPCPLVPVGAVLAVDAKADELKRERDAFLRASMEQQRRAEKSERAGKSLSLSYMDLMAERNQIHAERDAARKALARIAATIGFSPANDDDLCEAVREMERERVAAVEYADRRDIASQSAHGVPVAEIREHLVPSQDRVIAKLTRCPRCDRVVASEADFARDPRPGDDALCWDGVACRETDWRARALAAEAKALGRVIGLSEALAAAMEETDTSYAWKAREVVFERIRRLLEGGES